MRKKEKNTETLSLFITGKEFSYDTKNLAALFVTSMNLENFKPVDELFLFGFWYNLVTHDAWVICYIYQLIKWVAVPFFDWFSVKKMGKAGGVDN